MNIRVVIDTDVFVSACLGTGAASRVVAACLTGQCQPLMGVALLAEYEDVLSREALFGKSRLNSAERSELLDIFLDSCQWSRVYFGWRPNLPDEADNHLIELAVAGGAQFVVTRNLRHVARMELKFPGLQVVNPITLMKELSR